MSYSYTELGAPPPIHTPAAYPDNISPISFPHGYEPYDNTYHHKYRADEDDDAKPIIQQFEIEAEGNAGSTSFSTRWRLAQLAGWKFGVVGAAISATLCFLVNLIVTIWAVSTTHIGDDGSAVMFDGSCTRIRPLNVGVHFFINLMSTILLSSSNYCMQCLSAPTRPEVDKAHAKRIWLDIGVPSIRNLRNISTKRVIMWWILGLSSLPLHLFYNSAVFSSIAANEYNFVFVNEAFTQGNVVQNITTALDAKWDGLTSRLHTQAVSNNLERLENSACIRAYGQQFVSGRSNLLLVTDNGTDPQIFKLNTVRVSQPGDSTCGRDVFRWICINAQSSYGDCKETCENILSTVEADAANWTPYAVVGATFSPGSPPAFWSKVKYCLSERVEEHCRLQFSSSLAALVIVLNLLKAIIMWYLALGLKESPLLTVGDAISSFLDNPDPTTEGMCLFSKDHFTRRQAVLSFQYAAPGAWFAMPLQWTSQRRRWFSAASKKRWITTMCLYVAALLLVGILLGIGIHAMRANAASLWRLGIGAVSMQTLITGWDIPSKGASGLVGNSLIANLAQPVLSFLYFTYNGLFTCMMLASEWNRFSTQRKGLRVSGGPRGAQRSTYFLQLPYRFALPLMVVSGVLHWLVSQSIFLVSVTAFHPSDDGAHMLSYSASDGEDSSFMTCGYSPIAIIFVLIIGVLMILLVWLMGFRKFKPGMPLAGSCSAAISAACHPTVDKQRGWQAAADDRMATSAVQWGVTGAQGPEGIGHCSFTSKDVGQPQQGALYAGTGVRKRTQSVAEPRSR